MKVIPHVKLPSKMMIKMMKKKINEKKSEWGKFKKINTNKNENKKL